MKESQLDLFIEPHVHVKPRYYKDLSIHERINVKANSLGFAHVYIMMLRPGFNKVSIIRRDDHPEGLRWDRIKKQRELNSKNDTILWREQERNKKQELKFKK